MRANSHSFNVDLATKVGLIPALLLQHFYFWHQRSRDESNIDAEGHVWFFMSRKQITSIFPYLTESMIRTATKNLEELGYILEGEPESGSFNRAKWYAITDKGIQLLNQLGVMVKDTEKGEEDFFISKYLTVRDRFGRKDKDIFIDRFIEGSTSYNKAAAAVAIERMPYETFLKTPYWKSIARYVRLRDGERCNKCGSNFMLQVHHKTYRHHGYELEHLDDLVCLCKKCHSELHDIKETKK